MDNKMRLIDAMGAVIKISKKVQPLLGAECSTRDLYDVILRCIAEAPTVDAASEWIPVAERMPNEGERVLAFYQDGVHRVIYPDFLGFPLVYSKDLVWVKATHWMPLPDPPKEGK